MAHDILTIVYLTAAGVVAYGWASRRGSVERRLRGPGVSTAALTISRAIGLVGLLILVGAWLAGPPAEIPLAIGSLVLLWASSDPRLMVPRHANDLRTARAIWRQLDTLAEVRFDGPYDEDPRREAYESAIAELKQLRGPGLAELGRLLAEQAPNWLFQTRWSIDTARREILLFQLGMTLWPGDAPPQAPACIDRDTLWLLFVALMRLDETWRPEYSEPETRERLRRADALEQFRQRETASFIDVEQQLAYGSVGRLPLTPDDVGRLLAESQREMDHLFPSIRVFRGVSTDPEGSSP